MKKPNRNTDSTFMREAIAIANESRRLGDYAIGAAIVKGNRLIARAGNRIRTEMDASSHTEIIVMRMASRDLGSRYLNGCTLYTSHAPCPMCLSMAIWAKVSRIVYGVSQADIEEYGLKHGNSKYKWRSAGIEPEELYAYMHRANPNMKIVQFMRNECKKLFHNRP